MSQEYATIGPPRHECHACGMCCFGHNVVLMDDDEVTRTTEYGEKLGVSDPVVDGSVRFEDGRCVFLGEDLLCRIHKEFGGPQKPWLCQQYPIRGVRTETGEIRLVIEPTCINTWRNWQDAPVVDERPKVVRTKKMSQEAGIEQVLLRASAQPGMNVGAMLHILAGRRPVGTGLPEGFDRRLILRIQKAGFGDFLNHHEIGFGLREPIKHLIDFIPTLDADDPPPWPVLTDEQEGYVIESMRRMIFLRNGVLVPATPGVALLTLSGAVLLAWANPEPKAFGEAMACWCRCIQFKAWWLRMLPSPDTLAWLATGRGEEPPSPL